MLFQSPIWLWGLLPWAVLAVYLMIGRGQPAMVPFLRFWKGSVITARTRAWRMPPIFLLLLLMTMLLAIVAAAGPGYRSAGTSNGEITIVLDCGVTMARPLGAKNFRGVIDKAARELGSLHGKVLIVPVPGQPIETDGQNWVASAKAILPTVIAVLLDQAVADQLHQTRGPVVVLSDQNLTVTDERLSQIVPDPPSPDVAITHLAARSLPHPQVMVRLENHSELKAVHLLVTSGGASVDREVAIANAQDAFFDLPSLDPTITVELDSLAFGGSQSDPWHTAYLVRQSAGIRLSGLGNLPASVQHLAEVYSKHRPASVDARDVFISDHSLLETQPGIWIEATEDSTVTAPVTVAPHAVTRDVRTWPLPPSNATAPAGFAPLVSIGDHPIVAVRDSPVRQIWIRADFSNWEKMPDFVIFFANVLDWIAGTHQAFSSIAPRMLGSDWKSAADFSAGSWPGIYRSESGQMLAVNAGAYPSVSSPIEKKSIAIERLKTTEHTHSLSSFFVFAALLCLCIATAVWPRLPSPLPAK
jgi:hypothetical protein